MSVTSQGEGWWQASDGKWYPPESKPGQPAPSRPATSADLFPQGENDPMPAPGALKLVGRRAWKTWQLVLIALIAAGLGMYWNYKPVGQAAANANKSAYTLPPASGSGTTTTTTAAAGSTGGSGTTTTTSAGTTGTTAPGASTTGTTLPARLLLAGHQQSGNWTSTAFTTTAAGWLIGWAYQCTPAPATGSSLQVFVTPVGGSPSDTPAVTETGASGQNISTPQSQVGQFTLVVQAPANCEWAVKVTGN